MNKKKLLLLLAVFLIVVLIILLFNNQEKRLDPKSDLVTELYNKLGEVDINKCGGLTTYSDKLVDANALTSSNKLCMAYYQLDHNKKEENTTNSTKKNSNGINICKVGENTTFATDVNSDKECKYETISMNDLKESYKSLYGEEIANDDSFYISEEKSCYKEGETYYCGTSEKYNVSITPEATIYRIIDKVIETKNSDIIIYDYFLKISNGKCYTNNANKEQEDCSKDLEKKNLENDDEVISLVKKYGTIYKHTFQKDNNIHYWSKSELK